MRGLHALTLSPNGVAADVVFGFPDAELVETFPPSSRVSIQKKFVDPAVQAYRDGIASRLEL